jgi:tripartite motif-containing protein 71
MTGRSTRVVYAGVGALMLIGVQSLSGIAAPRGATTYNAALTTPSYAGTLAGSAVANMYSSGFEWDQVNQRIVVADTGRNLIEFYSPAGVRGASFGSFGSGNGQLNSPRDVAIDGSGNIYVADAGNSRVEKFDSNGNFVWASPGGPNSKCLYTVRNTTCLNQPIGVSWDATLNELLVADTGDSYIKEFANPTIPTNPPVWVSTSPSGKNILGFTDPRDVARGPGGYIWVSAYSQNQIKAYQVTGSGGTQTWTLKVTLGDGAKGGHGTNQLNFPYNVAFSLDGTYAYVSDIGNDRIAIYNVSNLNSPTWVGQYGSRCNQPCGNPGQLKGDTAKFAFLRRVLVEGSGGPNPGAVFGDDFWGNGMNAWNPPASNTPGSFLEQVDGVHAPAPGFAQAFGVAVGPGATPYIYGVDRLNQRIERFSFTDPACNPNPTINPNPDFCNVSGVRGSTKVADGFSWPEEAAVAPDGTVWLADTRNSRLQHWPANLSTAGVTDIGAKGPGLGQFNYIEGLTVDANGVVWVADTDNNRIESYNPGDGSFHVYGSLGSGSCQFDNPQGIAVVGSQVYVADTLNNRIVAMNVSGGSCSTSLGAWATYSAGLNNPQGVALASDGTVWVADSGHSAIVHLDAALLNNLGDGFGGPGTDNNSFNDPHSLAVIGNTLLVADTYNNRIQEYNIAGA